MTIQKSSIIYFLTTSYILHNMYMFSSQAAVAPALSTGQVNGRLRILTFESKPMHEPTATKFRTIDYVRERTP